MVWRLFFCTYLNWQAGILNGSISMWFNVTRCMPFRHQNHCNVLWARVHVMRNVRELRGKKMGTINRVCTCVRLSNDLHSISHGWNWWIGKHTKFYCCVTVVHVFFYSRFLSTLMWIVEWLKWNKKNNAPATKCYSHEINKEIFSFIWSFFCVCRVRA